MTRDELEHTLADIKEIVEKLEDIDGRSIPDCPDYELSEETSLEIGDLLLDLERLIY